MKFDVQKHKLAYLLLLFMIVAFIFSFFQFWPDRILLRGVSLMFIFSYFLWGVLVHRSSGHINSDIIKEYGLVSLVGGVVLLMLTY